MTNEERNTQILRLCGKKSYGLIANELGISRSVVAGVLFRKRWPREKRICSPGSHSGNMLGTGYRGYVRPAQQTLRNAAAEVSA